MHDSTIWHNDEDGRVMDERVEGEIRVVRLGWKEAAVSPATHRGVDDVEGWDEIG